MKQVFWSKRELLDRLHSLELLNNNAAKDAKDPLKKKYYRGKAEGYSMAAAMVQEHMPDVKLPKVK